MYNKNKIILLMIIAITIIVLGSLTYAYFSANNVQGNSETNTIVTLTANYGNVIVTYDNSKGIISASNINLKESEKGQNLNYLLKFNVENTGNISHEVTIKWKEVVNTFCQYANGQACTNIETDTYVGDEINYVLYSCNETDYTNETITNCTNIGANAYPKTGTTPKLTTNSYITLQPNNKTYYILTLTIQNKETEQNYNQGVDFTGKIDIKLNSPSRLIDEILTAYIPVSDAITSTYVNNANGINFGATSSPTNGQGLYINNKNSESGNVKYFRGGTYCWLNNAAIASSSTCRNAGGTWANYHCSLSDSKSACEVAGGNYYELKNNIIFGGFAWKIVRINADGTIKILYNGTSPISIGQNVGIGAIAFNSSASDNTYIGYMYGGTGKSTYALTHTNSTNSAIKNALDNWYNNNLISYASNIADTGFCGDRSLYSGNGYGLEVTYYNPYNRLYKNKTPTFSCINPNLDLYTLTTNSIGNKKLIYPIGLITADEVAYAGGVFYNNPNYTYYLQNGYQYWTMTPSYFSGTTAFGFFVYPYGDLNYGNVNAGSTIARPVINLKLDIMISSGTGTLSDPWLVQ